MKVYAFLRKSEESLRVTEINSEASGFSLTCGEDGRDFPKEGPFVLDCNGSQLLFDGVLLFHDGRLYGDSRVAEILN